MHKLIKIPIYNITIDVFIGPDTKYVHHYKQYTGDDVSEHVIGTGGLTTCAEFNDGKNFYSVWFPEFPKPSILAHEMLHMAWGVLTRAGVTVTKHNHEALTYLMGFLIDEFYSKYKKMNITAEQDGIKELIDGENSKEKYTNTQRQEESIQAVLNFDSPS